VIRLDRLPLPWLRAVGLPAGLALLTLRSVFHSGYLLQVDSAFGPRAVPIRWGLTAPVDLLEAAATRVLGGEAAGALTALGALFLCGFGAMVFFRRAPWYAQCLAGLAAMLNPWVYDRMIDGQFTIAASVGGLFLCLTAWESLVRRPGPARAVALALAAVGTVALMPQALGMLALLAVLGALSARVWRDRKRLLWLSAAAAGFAVVLLYGAIPFFLRDYGGGYSSVSHFGESDFSFFRSSRAAGHGLGLDLVGLYGYWGEQVGRFPLATGGWGWWPVAAVVVALAAAAGAWLRRDRAWLLAAGVISLGLAASTATPGGASAAGSVSGVLPFLGAYREPQKWSAVWLVAAVVLSVGAVEVLARDARGRAYAGALAYALALAVLLPAGYTEVRKLSSVVRPVNYPAAWWRLRAAMPAIVPSQAEVAVLPWHLYESMPFAANRLVANPARVFFPGHLVIASTPEIPGRIEEPTARLQAIATGAVSPWPCALADAIRAAGIQWALLLDARPVDPQSSRLEDCGFRVISGGPGGPRLFASH
jgi:hypothetical protein